MKIRVISDLHIDVNERFPFSLKGEGKDVYALVAGDVSGGSKATANWIKQNIHNGCFIVGNHDPAYNEDGITIQQHKLNLHNKFPLENNVTFLDESVGLMTKEIPGTNILVIGSTLYTDYKYMEAHTRRTFENNNKWRKEHNDELLTVEGVNMSMASPRIGRGGLNDFIWGHVPDEKNPGKQRHLEPEDCLKWFNDTFTKIKWLVESNKDKDIIVMTHHGPSPKVISERYVGASLNASYVSDLEWFILANPNIKAWVCGHVHNVTIDKIGDTLLVCNPRGYERDFEAGDWNPNTFIDTDKWEVVTEDWKSSEKLSKARKSYSDAALKYAAMFF